MPIVSLPDTRSPPASTVRVTFPAPVVRALTSTLTAEATIVGVTSGSASANVIDAAPNVSFAFALTVAVTLMDPVWVVWA